MICNKMGEVLEVLDSEVNYWASSMRIRVAVNVNGPLKHATIILNRKGSKNWVYFIMKNFQTYAIGVV